LYLVPALLDFKSSVLHIVGLLRHLLRDGLFYYEPDALVPVDTPLLS
jgi:hypothetical protein